MTGMARTTGATEMPFLDHLEELRNRLFWVAGALVIGVVAGFIVLSQFDIITILERPIAPYLQGQKLIYTHPGTSFKIVMNASFIVGILLASPVLVYQLWGFLSPALHSHEKRVIIPILIAMVLLFVGGLALAYFVVLPFTLKFLLGFESKALTPMISATEYFDFAIGMSLAFGIVFELPIAILMLTIFGLVTPAFLITYRKHALLLCVIASAFITPGTDPTSLFALAIPLYGLYEVSIVASGIVYRRRVRKEAARALENAESTTVNQPV